MQCKIFLCFSLVVSYIILFYTRHARCHYDVSPFRCSSRALLFHTYNINIFQKWFFVFETTRNDRSYARVGTHIMIIMIILIIWYHCAVAAWRRGVHARSTARTCSRRAFVKTRSPSPQPSYTAPFNDGTGWVVILYIRAGADRGMNITRGVSGNKIWYYVDMMIRCIVV